MSPLIPLTGSVAFGAAGQIILKYGVSLRKVSHARSKSASAFILLWLACFGIATLLWLWGLKQADISYAYPLLGGGYVLVTILAAVLLRERVTAIRWVAIAIITTGVILVGTGR